MSDDDLDPLVIFPLDFEVEAAWKGHEPAMKALEDSEGCNLAAAYCADPGIVGCPKCNKHTWAFGLAQKCRECGCEFDTNWWPMYSWGVQARWAGRAMNDRYAASPYYRFGFADMSKKKGDSLPDAAFKEMRCADVERRKR